MEIKMKKKEGQNMKEPTLVIMAAGMGSRYGGLKQMDPMDSQGPVSYTHLDVYKRQQQWLRTGYHQFVLCTALPVEE